VPWLDDRGRFSPPKCGVFAALFLPALWTAWMFWHGDFGLARPVNEAIHEIGRWASRLLLMALAITPLRWSLRLPWLPTVRRMIGIATFAYVVLHVTLYIADQAFDLSRVTTEVIDRMYLKLGFYALLVLAYLAATSSDRMVRSLGVDLWKYLHRGIFAAAALALVHDFMQAEANVDEPCVMAGLFAWLVGYRVIAAAFGLRRGLPWWAVGVLTVAAAALTAAGESLYYWADMGADPRRVLAAYLDVTMLRPGWIVLAIGLAVTVAAFGADRLARRRADEPGRAGGEARDLSAADLV
jgi:methionine sulfoxide reductase heme-binding subunit